jgi:hypothetical protein
VASGAGVYDHPVLRARILLALLALPLAVAGCGGGGTDLPVGEAEQEIRRVVADLYGEQFAVGGVRCPGRVEQREGNTFFCLASVEGKDLPIRVRQTNDDGGVNIGQAEALLPVEQVERFVTDYARRHGTPVASVTCGPDRILIRRPGEHMTCDVVFETGADGFARMQVIDVKRNIAMQRLSPNP